ncbi:HlyD family secretion protein [Haloferula luteola]|uniref:HlyD family secretion protein n=1 Tax=Haloferula luteola TaxID=595692 RepID=A0A840V524_9BACT|nr:efflux RND transporter periplasmic adaptor subunit [Haloferula luteola]MBB5350734.1 HlyD family secretion protein [Haloferula luteola]
MSKSQPEEDLAAIVRSGASRPMKKVVVGVVVLVLVAGGVAYFLKNEKAESGKTHYVTEPAEKTDISIVVTASGNLAPTNQIVVGSELSGTVTEIYVDTNDTVTKGQELLRLDTTKLEQQTERSRASLLSAKAQLSQAEATLEEERATLARQEELLELSGGKTPSRAVMAASRAAVARAEANVESAKATIAASEADIGSYESDLQKAIIRSPVDGMVLARSIEVGQTVAASFTAPTLFTIAEDLTTMELVVSVSEADIGRVKEGQTATFNVDAWTGRTYTATVKKVAFGSADLTSSSTTTATTGGVVTYDTELSVENKDLSLRPGMTATVDIQVVNEVDVLAVPNSALRFDPALYEALANPEEKDQTLVQSMTPGGRRWRRDGPRKSGGPGGPPTVWILKNGEPAKVVVETGVTDGSMTQITSGDLDPGTEVLTSIEPPKS